MSWNLTSFPKLIPIAAVAMLLSVMSTSALAQARPACNTDTLVARRSDSWAVYTATATSSRASFRRSHLMLPAVPVDSSQVALITDTATCEQARTALAQLYGVGPQGLSVIVVRVDTLYLVSDPDFQQAGEWKGAYSFTATFGYLAGLDW